MRLMHHSRIKFFEKKLYPRIDKLSLDDAVIAYREEYIIERNFGRLKDKPLSLTPMYLQRDDHATGLVRLLTIGYRG